MLAPVIVRSRGSFVNEVEAGPHKFVFDEPESAGGTNTGPTPYDALAAALGSCTSMTLHFYAKREKIPLEGVDVEITHDRQYAKDCADCTTTTSGYIHRFNVGIRLHGASLTAEQRQKLLSIAGRCPVAKTLQNEIRIDKVLLETTMSS
ncbi:MAG TPA: OsmC family protein [Thermoanaerobaculia bacterium]|nr:OsmC family protein [Thermoanaerobaculia bacterium]